MQQYLGAFAKGKGKGNQGGGVNQPFSPPTGLRGGGKGGTGGGKGGPGGGGKGGYSGTCWHCHEPGHRRQECPKYTAFPKAQGKGGGSPGYLNQVGSEEAFGFGVSSLPEEEANAAAWALGAAEEGADYGPVLNGSLNALTAEIPPLELLCRPRR